MSDIVANVIEQNSAQSKEVTAPPTKTVVDVTANNYEAAVNAVPGAADTFCAPTNEIAVDTGLVQDTEKSSSPKVDDKKTPVKRTPYKRMSFIERAQKESEELVKNMGGSLEIEGGRRTRSSTRGTPTTSAAASTPPPAKKNRSSPASGTSTPTRPRARGRKIDVVDDAAEEEDTKTTPAKRKTPAKGQEAAAKDVAENEVEDNSKESTDKFEEAEKKVGSVEPISNVSESKGTPAGNEGQKETADGKVVGKPDVDDTDAALKPIVEETQRQLTTDLLPTVTETSPVEITGETTKGDTPMETEDDVPVKVVTEKNEAKCSEQTEKEEQVELAPKEAVKAFQELKEPTPEPMEVDSSSRSNDASERMDDDVVEIIEATEITKEPTKIVENQQSAAEITAASATKTSSVEKTVKENSVVANPPPKGDVVSNAITKPVAGTDVVDANERNKEETITHASNDLNKTESNSCEPKIITSPSPQISAAKDTTTTTTAGTTPQTCN